MRNSYPANFNPLASIHKAATNHGLLFVGISTLNVSSDAARYQSWIEEGRHGKMDWMENHLEIRKRPDLLLPGAKTALIFGFPYFLGDRWTLGNKDSPPRVAQYARLKDYHKFMRSKLSSIQKDMEKILGADHLFRITVDSAPLLERALAAKTGSMFIGKNTCAIDPKRGSFFLLGEILTTWSDGELAQDQASTHQKRSTSGGCGTCRRCQVHCPTGALDKDYQIDARKCLSYWTIENRGEIPTEYWTWVARYMFGCDICQLVCPYNRNLDASGDAHDLIKIRDVDLFAMVTMDQAYYESIFGGTPMTRAKRSGLRRNALIASVVRRDERVIAIIESMTNDPDPVICATAKTAINFLQTNKNC